MTRILIIDDDPELRDQIATTLLAAFYETSTATDGQDGVQKALRNPPDLIICDMVMPHMGGQRVLAELRSHPQTASTPFIFLTGVDDRATVRDSMNLGADDYLFKPFQVNELLGAVSARLRHHQQIVADVEGQLEALKTRLSRTITHELRTPLMVIMQPLEMLSRHIQQLPAEEVHDLIASMSQGAYRLAHCIEQMVFATQLTTGTLSSQIVSEQGLPMALRELLPASIKMAERFVIVKPGDITIKLVDPRDDLFVKGNPAALKHAIAEVIANALAFSPLGGVVRVNSRQDNHHIRIVVTDNGIGIPQERLREALTWFSQIDRETHEQQGMGMGLPLASQLAGIHGGTLDIRSVVGKGTQVIITLPLTTPA